MQILELRGRLGIGAHPRVDHDHLAARGGDAERRLAQPQNLGLASLREGRARDQGDQ